MQPLRTMRRPPRVAAPTSGRRVVRGLATDTGRRDSAPMSGRPRQQRRQKAFGLTGVDTKSRLVRLEANREVGPPEQAGDGSIHYLEGAKRQCDSPPDERVNPGEHPLNECDLLADESRAERDRFGEQVGLSAQFPKHHFGIPSAYVTAVSNGRPGSVVWPGNSAVEQVRSRQNQTPARLQARSNVTHQLPIVEHVFDDFETERHGEHTSELVSSVKVTDIQHLKLRCVRIADARAFSGYALVALVPAQSQSFVTPERCTDGKSAAAASHIDDSFCVACLRQSRSDPQPSIQDARIAVQHRRGKAEQPDQR